jgi:hypothetical protein
MHKSEAATHTVTVWRQATGLSSLPPDQQYWTLGSKNDPTPIEPKQRAEMFLRNIRREMARDNFKPGIVYMDFHEHGVLLDQATKTAVVVVDIVASMSVMVVIIFPSNAPLPPIEAELRRLGYVSAAPTEINPEGWIMYTVVTSSFGHLRPVS